MRAIWKTAEPAVLVQYRAGADPHDLHAYENFPGKAVVRAQLVMEQRGLCAFCGGRIVNDPREMKIAHWKPRFFKIVAPHGGETYPNLPSQLDYGNLLGACKGNEGQAASKQHCDTHQGNSMLSRNPADPAHHIEDTVSFPPDGSIASSDPRFHWEIGGKGPDGEFQRGVLNLNLPFLRKNRQEALQAFFVVGLRKRGPLTKAQVETLLSKWRGDPVGTLEPFSPVVAYWLRKRLARM